MNMSATEYGRIEVSRFKLLQIGGETMATHHGGKVGAAAKTLASSSTSKAAKTAAAKTLVKHQIAKHR